MDAALCFLDTTFMGEARLWSKTGIPLGNPAPRDTAKRSAATRALAHPLRRESADDRADELKRVR